MRRGVRIGKKPRTILRSFEGEYVDGFYQEPPKQELCVWGNIQPASESNRATFLAEGDRSKEAILLICNERVFMPNSMYNGKLIKADIIVHDGAYWEVIGVKTHQNETLPHTEAIAIRLNETPRDRLEDSSTWWK